MKAIRKKKTQNTTVRFAFSNPHYFKTLLLTSNLNKAL